MRFEWERLPRYWPAALPPNNNLHPCQFVQPLVAEIQNDVGGHHGKIEEIEVSCIEPYSQLLFHLGYDYDENDMHDVKLLCEVFHMELPEEYR